MEMDISKMESLLFFSKLPKLSTKTQHQPIQCPLERVCQCENVKVLSGHDERLMTMTISIQVQTAVFFSLVWQWVHWWPCAKSRESDKQMRQELSALSFPWNVESGDTVDGICSHQQCLVFVYEKHTQILLLISDKAISQWVLRSSLWNSVI